MSGVDTGESDTFDIRLPIQFQSIFHGEKFKLGEYTGLLGYETKADSKIDSAILSKAKTELPEEVRDIFFVGVKKRHLNHPTMTTPIDIKEYDGMYREFSDWLMERRDNFVLEYIIDNEVLRHSNFWVKGTATVYVELDMQFIYLSCVIEA